MACWLGFWTSLTSFLKSDIHSRQLLALLALQQCVFQNNLQKPGAKAIFQVTLTNLVEPFQNPRPFCSQRALDLSCKRHTFKTTSILHQFTNRHSASNLYIHISSDHWVSIGWWYHITNV
jgi:hypothetical protein